MIANFTEYMKGYEPMKNNQKKIYFVGFVVVLAIVLYFTMTGYSFAFTPRIVDKLSNAFEDIEKWLVRLSTPAAAVSIAVGLFMKKFSFGDEERIRVSKKVIRNSVVAYAIILALNLILEAIKNIVT